MRSARDCAASGAASVGRKTYMMSASEPMPSSRPPNRPMPITANSMPSGPVAPDRRDERRDVALA